MDAGLARLNALPAEDAREELRACCAATAWVEAVVAGRPYPDVSALHRAGAAALAALDWAGVREALAAHPRIGARHRAALREHRSEERARSGPGRASEATRAMSREAAWSAGEQSGMDSSTDETRAALVEVNRAYEERFGHVFLIFATGKTDEQMLAAARERVHHDDAVEQETVRAELSKIVDLRLTKLLDAR